MSTCAAHQEPYDSNPYAEVRLSMFKAELELRQAVKQATRALFDADAGGDGRRSDVDALAGEGASPGAGGDDELIQHHIGG